MKKLILFLSFLLTHNLWAQFGDAFAFNIGFNLEQVNFERQAFNDFLTDNNMQLGEMPRGNVGVSWNIAVHPFILGFDFLSSSRTKDYANSSVVNSMKSFSVDFGYSLFKNKNYVLYPYLGFRSLIYGYSNRNYNQESSDFNQSLTQYSSFTSIENKLYAANIGVAFNSFSSYGLSLKVGTSFPFKSRNWHNTLSEQKLKNGPEVRSLFYVKIAVTIGGLQDDAEHRELKNQSNAE